MLEIVAHGVWLFLAGFAFWFMFKAKEFQPLTLDDLALIWRIHKRQTGRRASRIHGLLVKNQSVGFNYD